jgi:hypothetical protein
MEATSTSRFPCCGETFKASEQRETITETRNIRVYVMIVYPIYTVGKIICCTRRNSGNSGVILLSTSQLPSTSQLLSTAIKILSSIQYLLYIAIMSSYTPRHSGGRPPKYSSPDERNAARQARRREDTRRHRERKRAERLSYLQSPQFPNNHPEHISNEVSLMLSSEAESLNLHAVGQNSKNTPSLYSYRP